jgi:energy-coupling factor transporter ATP-binding protein EcfA2
VIDIHLLLIEGPPGSGKSTTAELLAGEIARAGQPCQCFQEWHPENPIAIGSDLDLEKVVSTAMARDGEVLEQWQELARSRQGSDVVTVMESRFWQTSVMLMYAAGSPLEQIIESNRRVVEAIQPLKPALIYFAFDDLRALTLQTIEVKEAEWQRAGFPATWVGHIYEAMQNQAWFRQQSLSGLEAYLSFLEEWALISQQLYDRLPFPKLTVQNPNRAWPVAMQHMRQFLRLPQ